ncbi:MAG: class I SAM-dependent methyltransferase [Planctomycetota bacterium]|jgi:SAM-dependent methyltransferase
MEALRWLAENLDLRPVETPEFIYDDMESQSGECLPILYQPFDAGAPSHWGDRGALFDFLHATRGEGARLLDFGPGDGWPSLIVAPFAGEVVGVDGSRRRVEVCTENARRLGIENASFVHVPAGSALPFEDESFDGVMAASSLEQSPDPRASLSELWRILKPGGRMRIVYEALGRYVPGREREIGTWAIDDRRSMLLLYDRDVEAERVTQYRLTLTVPEREVQETLGGCPVTSVETSVLESWRDAIVDACVCETRHPSGRTLRDWMLEVGFTEVRPTHSGGLFAYELLDRIPEAERPGDLEGVDALMRPAVSVVVELPAPIETDPRLTAVK